MQNWAYSVRDKDSDKELLYGEGFMTKEDARLQGEMEAKVRILRNYYVVSFMKSD